MYRGHCPERDREKRRRQHLTTAKDLHLSLHRPERADELSNGRRVYRICRDQHEADAKSKRRTCAGRLRNSSNPRPRPHGLRQRASPTQFVQCLQAAQVEPSSHSLEELMMDHVLELGELRRALDVHERDFRLPDLADGATRTGTSPGLGCRGGPEGTQAANVMQSVQTQCLVMVRTFCSYHAGHPFRPIRVRRRNPLLRAAMF